MVNAASPHAEARGIRSCQSRKNCDIVFGSTASELVPWRSL